MRYIDRPVTKWYRELKGDYAHYRIALGKYLYRAEGKGAKKTCEFTYTDDNNMPINNRSDNIVSSKFFYTNPVFMIQKIKKHLLLNNFNKFNFVAYKIDKIRGFNHYRIFVDKHKDGDIILLNNNEEDLKFYNCEDLIFLDIGKKNFGMP